MASLVRGSQGPRHRASAAREDAARPDASARGRSFNPLETFNDLYLMDLRPPPQNRSWVSCRSPGRGGLKREDEPSDARSGVEDDESARQWTFEWGSFGLRACLCGLRAPSLVLGWRLATTKYGDGDDTDGDGGDCSDRDDGGDENDGGCGAIVAAILTMMLLRRQVGMNPGTPNSASPPTYRKGAAFAADNGTTLYLFGGRADDAGAVLLLAKGADIGVGRKTSGCAIARWGRVDVAIGRPFDSCLGRIPILLTIRIGIVVITTANARYSSPANDGCSSGQRGIHKRDTRARAQVRCSAIFTGWTGARCNGLGWCRRTGGPGRGRAGGTSWRGSAGGCTCSGDGMRASVSARVWASISTCARL